MGMPAILFSQYVHKSLLIFYRIFCFVNIILLKVQESRKDKQGLYAGSYTDISKEKAIYLCLDRFDLSDVWILCKTIDQLECHSTPDDRFAPDHCRIAKGRDQENGK